MVFMQLKTITSRGKMILQIGPFKLHFNAIDLNPSAGGLKQLRRDQNSVKRGHTFSHRLETVSGPSCVC